MRNMTLVQHYIAVIKRYKKDLLKVIMGNESDSFLLNPLSSPTSLNDSIAILGTLGGAILCKQGDASNGCATNGGT